MSTQPYFEAVARQMPQARYVLPDFEERTAYGFRRQNPLMRPQCSRNNGKIRLCPPNQKMNIQCIIPTKPPYNLPCPHAVRIFPIPIRLHQICL